MGVLRDHQQPGCRAFYDQRRAAGDLHHQALRALGNRLVGILVPSPCPNYRARVGTGGIGRSTDMRVDLHKRLHGRLHGGLCPTFQAGHAGSIPVTRSPVGPFHGLAAAWTSRREPARDVGRTEMDAMHESTDRQNARNRGFRALQDRPVLIVTGDGWSW